MRKFMLLAAVAALSACSQEPAEEPVANEAIAETDASATDAAAAPEVVSASQSLHRTSWTFTMDGKQIFESIDENGNYIADTVDGEHYDHGSYALKDGKACFTSAMNEDGEICWTGGEARVGETATVTNEKGEALEVTRAEYRPLTMPS